MNTALAIAFIAVGVMIGAVVVRGLKRGVLRDAWREEDGDVYRAEQPFWFWLAAAIGAIVSCASIIAGIVMLVQP